MHSSNDHERFCAQSSDGVLRDCPGFLLQLGVRLQDLGWIAARSVWTARFSLQIVHEARGIEVIHWYDTFQKSSMDVSARPTEVVAGQVSFAGVVRWDV